MGEKVNFDKISTHSGPEESPGFLLWRASTLWRRTLEKKLKSFDLTHPQFVILATTAWLTKDGNEASQADISRQAGLDPNTTSQILRGLEKKALIQRHNTFNERNKHPTLTAKGSKILSQALPAVEKEDAEFFGKLKQDTKKCVEILQKLI